MNCWSFLGRIPISATSIRLFFCPSQVANFSEAGGLRSKWRRSQSVVSGVRIVETPDEQRLGRWKVVGFPLVVR